MKRDKKIIKLTPEAMRWYFERLQYRIYVKNSTTWPEAERLMALNTKLRKIMERIED